MWFWKTESGIGNWKSKNQHKIWKRAEKVNINKSAGKD